jgi:homoserine dehydrogenase
MAMAEIYPINSRSSAKSPSPQKMSLHIALIGPGLVGKAFLSQIHQFKHPKVAVKVIGIMSSSRMTLGTEVTTVAEGQPKNLELFLEHMKKHQPCVLVDCTSSDDIAQLYPKVLEFAHIVTPNKKGFSGPIELYKNTVQSSMKNSKFVLHESTVGAGLPILSTLNDLVQTGDEIVKIEGIFSGTLSYIFNQFSQWNGPSCSFSEVVKQAKELGYTEPDPRDDLNGMDVARKVVILGRLSGLELDTQTLQVENIVPEPLRTADAASFMQRLPQYDPYFTELNQNAKKENSVLRFVGVVTSEGSKVSLEKYPSTHPFASLKGSDNIIAFTTKRFPNPLIVQGAGAGAAVTAFGMFSDILKIAKTIVGPL